MSARYDGGGGVYYDYGEPHATLIQSADASNHVYHDREYEYEAEPQSATSDATLFWDEGNHNQSYVDELAAPRFEDPYREADTSQHHVAYGYNSDGSFATHQALPEPDDYIAWTRLKTPSWYDVPGLYQPISNPDLDQHLDLEYGSQEAYESASDAFSHHHGGDYEYDYEPEPEPAEEQLETPPIILASQQPLIDRRRARQSGTLAPHHLSSTSSLIPPPPLSSSPPPMDHLPTPHQQQGDECPDQNMQLANPYPAITIAPHIPWPLPTTVLPASTSPTAAVASTSPVTAPAPTSFALATAPSALSTAQFVQAQQERRKSYAAENGAGGGERTSPYLPDRPDLPPPPTHSWALCSAKAKAQEGTGSGRKRHPLQLTDGPHPLFNPVPASSSANSDSSGGKKSGSGGGGRKGTAGSSGKGGAAREDAPEPSYQDSPPSPGSVLKVSATKKTCEKKPVLACLFCRGRKIACGPPVAGSKDRTCNQCARRHLKCEYPTESRRGQRKRTASGADDSKKGGPSDAAQPPKPAKAARTSKN